MTMKTLEINNVAGQRLVIYTPKGTIVITSYSVGVDEVFILADSTVGIDYHAQRLRARLETLPNTQEGE